MSRTVYWIARFALDAFAYVLAAIVATVFLMELFLTTSGRFADPGERFIDLFVVLPMMTAHVARNVFVPSLVLIVFAEFRAVRDWLYYALGGIAAALAAGAVAWFPRFHGDHDATAIAVVCAAGAIGGIAYWLIAGRSAGIRRTQTTSPGSSGS